MDTRTRSKAKTSRKTKRRTKTKAWTKTVTTTGKMPARRTEMILSGLKATKSPLSRFHGLTRPGNPPSAHGLRNSSPDIDLMSESESF